MLKLAYLKLITNDKHLRIHCIEKNCLHTHFHVLALIEIFLILLLIIIKNMYVCLKKHEENGTN